MIDRWIPSTHEELAAAVRDGRLDEGQHLDFKRELSPGRKHNVELARDLAMFANDGGMLIFGVDEPEAGQFVPAPIAVDGLRERIEQVAASRLQPPLHVDVRTIPAEDDGATGFVLVRIPVSQAAPHMVEGRYHGRAGTTRTVLADTQVRAVIASRKAAVRPIYDLLEADLARDPIPADRRAHAHLHVVARPRYAADDLVLGAVQRCGDDWGTWFYTQLLAEDFDPPLGRWGPDLKRHTSRVGRRAAGAALYSHYMEQDRSTRELLADDTKVDRHESGLLDFEVDEDGTLHLFCGRGSDTLENSGEVLFPTVVVGLVLRVVQAAARISVLTSHVGAWDFATGLTGLRGVVLHRPDWIGPTPAHSAEGYRNATSSDTAELTASPQACAERLVGRLLRGLGHDGGVNAIFPTTT